MKMDMEHISQLAKIQLGEAERQTLLQSVQPLLTIADGLPPADDDKFLLNPDNVMALRPDTVCRSLSRDELLKNAPQKQAGCIVVPKTV